MDIWSAQHNGNHHHDVLFSQKRQNTRQHKKHQAFAIPAPEQWRQWHLLCTSLHLATVSAALRYTWASLHVAPSLPESKEKNAVIDHWDEPQVFHSSNYIYSLNICFQADPSHSSRTWLCMGDCSFTQSFFIIHQSGMLTALFGCYMAGVVWNC